MDLVALALAKKYADEKVINGLDEKKVKTIIEEEIKKIIGEAGSDWDSFQELKEKIENIQLTPGPDGYSPVVELEQISDGVIVKVINKEGVTTATIYNGAQGIQGIQGEQGPKGDTGEQGDKGDKGDPGEPGVDGADYVLTDADKSEIAELAAELVEVPEAPEISMQPLTFTGAVEATYDGSKPVEVEIPQGGGGGWKKVAEYVWDGNKEYQPLALDYATGEMVFDTAPPARFAMWPVPNIDGVSNPVDLHSLYAKIPNEFLNAAPTSGMALSENGYTFGGVTKIAEGGVNANVDVSAFRFEVNNTVPSFSGLNAKRVKISFFAPGGNVFPNNNGFNFNAKLSNGQTVTLSAASGSSRLLYGWYEQDISVENNVLRNYFSLYGRFFKTRTSATQSGTNEKEGSVYPVFAVPDDVTIAEVYFSTGNGNFRPCNGTVVEVYVYED